MRLAVHARPTSAPTTGGNPAPTPSAALHALLDAQDRVRTQWERALAYTGLIAGEPVIDSRGIQEAIGRCAALGDAMQAAADSVQAFQTDWLKSLGADTDLPAAGSSAERGGSTA